MGLPPRSSFSLEEVSEAWGTTVRALLGYGVDGKLAISVMLFAMRADLCRESSTGQIVPLGRSNLQGAHGLFEQDLWTLNSRGVVFVRRFRAGDGIVAELLEDHAGVEITASELAVTAEERARFEQANGISAINANVEANAGVDWEFGHKDDYSEITFAGTNYPLSPKRAAVVRLLHQAWLAGSPWMQDHTLLAQAGSQSERLVDLFKPLPGWRDIIQSDRKGKWRLRLADRQADLARRSHFRHPNLRLVR